MTAFIIIRQEISSFFLLARCKSLLLKLAFLISFLLATLASVPQPALDGFANHIQSDGNDYTTKEIESC